MRKCRVWGPTMVLVTIVDDYAYVANVGDSRLYLIEDRIVQITKDHSLVEEMGRRGLITREDASIIRIKILLPESSASDRK